MPPFGHGDLSVAGTRLQRVLSHCDALPSTVLGTWATLTVSAAATSAAPWVSGCPPRLGPSVWRWHQVVARSVTNASGARSAHTGMAYGHLVWNAHPEGGASGLGMLPESTSRWRCRCSKGWGMGTADRSASV